MSQEKQENAVNVIYHLVNAKYPDLNILYHKSQNTKSFEYTDIYKLQIIISKAMTFCVYKKSVVYKTYLIEGIVKSLIKNCTTEENCMHQNYWKWKDAMLSVTAQFNNLVKKGIIQYTACKPLKVTKIGYEETFCREIEVVEDKQFKNYIDKEAKKRYSKLPAKDQYSNDGNLYVKLMSPYDHNDHWLMANNISLYDNFKEQLACDKNESKDDKLKPEVKGYEIDESKEFKVSKLRTKRRAKFQEEGICVVNTDRSKNQILKAIREE